MLLPTSVFRARRALNNLRGVVRRTGITGFQNRSARIQYEQAFRWVVAVEDELGVEHEISIGLSDRLVALRREAQDAGLLTPSEIFAAEKAAMHP